MNVPQLKRARVNAGLTQRRMSEITGIPKRAIENWDQGLCSPSPWMEAQLLKWLKEVEEQEKRKEGKDAPYILASLRQEREKLQERIKEIDAEIATLNSKN